MNQLREAAVAYYQNGSPELQQRAWNFFKAMDIDGDKKVSLHEYISFLRQAGYNWIQPEFFADLDQNGDGTLDFWEVLTLYYIIKTRNVLCNSCQKNLHGLYFTCVTCYDHPKADSYDLCCTCYGRRNFSHGHSLFLDNYVLLRSKMSSPYGGMHAIIQPNQAQVNAIQAGRPQRIKLLHAFQALEAAFAIGSYASSLSCSIM